MGGPPGRVCVGGLVFENLRLAGVVGATVASASSKIVLQKNESKKYFIRITYFWRMNVSS
jgi:hypothetical protein